MPDLDEAGGQDVLQEATQKLHARDRGGVAILGAESHAALVHRHQPVVRDADAVCIGAQISNDLFGASHGALAVGYPLELLEHIGAESSTHRRCTDRPPRVARDLQVLWTAKT